MNPLENDHVLSQPTTTPPWMQELLAQIKTISFIADDEELELKCCSMIMQDRCEAEAPYADLDILEEEADFTKELSALIKSKWTGTKRELCDRALLLENTFYKIQAGKRQPGRDTLLSLALALGLAIPEAQHLLGYHGYGLSGHIKRDFLIMRCLEMGKTPMEVNGSLDQCGLRLLGPNE